MLSSEQLLQENPFKGALRRVLCSRGKEYEYRWYWLYGEVGYADLGKYHDAVWEYINKVEQTVKAEEMQALR